MNIIKHLRSSVSKFLTLSALCSVVLFNSVASAADEKPTFRLAWTIYVGWMPWDYGNASGIVKKWADKYDINIEVVQVNDYVESINQYTAGGFDATVMTNMDALTIPAASGVDSTAVIIGDFSNGNDGVVLKGKKTLADIKGQNINLVELSVSHYLLARALETISLTERDVRVVNTSDADLVAAFTTDDVTAVTTWNPLLSEITAMPNTSKVFDSSMIPGEIIDLLVVNTQTLNDNPKLGKALTGAWYEIMATMQGSDQKAIDARTMMAEASGTDLAGYDAQLASTKMFFNAKDAVMFNNSADLKNTMGKVAEFSFKHGLLGEGASDATFIGIETPSGVYGNKQNIKLRFTPSFMQMAIDNKL
ncbi:putative urea ABC transporter substrate-binding protein [Colwellia sp. 4_MG-2023]|jgi:NitT/TauT family transport system substrate-binding protein|uniref:putative urea ABC transporter substrate-binding protein n=1 Tax=unclassified Colwellia TaxID=196834 RepID=UPI0026E28708|nr:MULTISPECIES: putative urea ABC transporter substrate-binding protein [unclassified Colwellia]MDO6487628.1 putative urea ABC transporter substrate-binding protein [Colwellia sp. 6_MG-2023]MDO6507357.1 putative urea ABC transporter substrate-binding protein [Colwellia sp. 5_MG-2023]MDO6556090.1 putative urea ABC transporter substrate-binding protein [Colwellia sp. 4_MG-2023]